MNVVFQDAEGNEITRVGDFSGRRRPISPIIVQDEYGRELYRTSDPHIHRRGEPDRPERSILAEKERVVLGLPNHSAHSDQITAEASRQPLF
ncbi:hypothetical protein C8R46DRAFT_632149 [Mycena filopes]|nr:hypothetical protein C8R46DRAFT_632149 [Mycena filopes]